VIRAHFGQTSRDTSGCRERGNQTALQGVVDTNFTKEQPRIMAQRVVNLRSPTSDLSINEAYSDEIPNSVIPFLVNGIALNRV
jgi:hypothetical protein